MKEIIKKIISGGAISQPDIVEFITKHTELFERPIQSPQELQGILQAFQGAIIQGQIVNFNLMYAIKLACVKLDIPLRILYDANGMVIKQYIQGEE